ncbi:MAG: hypothetical protein M1817_004191 [Caeruleum heppii]|nr:MAG: hypothetical protein M1817_004191 [Caeruleum heppii]
MARLHEEDEDDLPDLATVIGGSKCRQGPVQQSKGEAIESTTTDSQHPVSSSNTGFTTTRTNAFHHSRTRSNAGERSAAEEIETRIQHTPLTSKTNGISPPASRFHIWETKIPILAQAGYGKRMSPVRSAKKSINYRQPRIVSDDLSESEASPGDSLGSLADFIVDDDSSLDLRTSTRSQRKPLRIRSEKSLGSRQKDQSVGAVDLISPKRQDRKGPVKSVGRRSKDTLSSDDEEGAILKLKVGKSTRFLTPPSSPTRTNREVGSPAKQPRIPPSPHRPSVDAFWSQETINEWNDQYSPRKTPLSERSRGWRRVIDDSDDSDVPPASPRKTPRKKDRAAVENKRAFDAKKHDMAKTFLAELDDRLTAGQIGSLTATSGGIQLMWSRTLNSTAGRANWKRSVTKHRNPDGSHCSTTYRHIASIELAEKVIDSEDRLKNVLAHEYCHLANFIISGVKNNPHGKEFKAWAAKCSALFADQHIVVTTKHSYTISYKYIWACTNATCATEFSRHSKSIDPTRHTCGACKSKLVQIQPVPRAATAVGAGPGETAKPKPSAYQLFVKEHLADVRRAMAPGSPQKDVMAEVGRRYRADKAAQADEAKGEKARTGSSNLTDGASERNRRKEREERRGTGDEDLEAVSRKLDFLTLVEVI